MIVETVLFILMLVNLLQKGHAPAVGLYKKLSGLYDGNVQYFA